MLGVPPDAMLSRPTQLSVVAGRTSSPSGTATHLNVALWLREMLRSTVFAVLVCPENVPTLRLMSEAGSLGSSATGVIVVVGVPETVPAH